MHGSAIAVGDINGDGILDLVVTNATAGDHADTSILLGIKGGGFEPTTSLSARSATTPSSSTSTETASSTWSKTEASPSAMARATSAA